MKYDDTWLRGTNIHAFPDLSQDAGEVPELTEQAGRTIKEVPECGGTTADVMAPALAEEQAQDQ